MTTTDKNHHQRQGHPSVKAAAAAATPSQVPSSSSRRRKNNHHRSTPSTSSSSKSNLNELMLIDPSELSDLSSASWQEGSSEEFFEHDQGNRVEKLLWVGEKRFVRKSSFRQSEEGEEQDLTEGRLICPELGPRREQVKAESIRRYFGGGSRTRLQYCPREEGLLCLEAPVAVAVAYKYEIQLSYSLDRVARIESPSENRTTHHRIRIKITNIITSFHGPLVNESSSRIGKRTPTEDGDGTTQVDNTMLLELALVNLGQQEQHQQHHRSELVRVNIDPDCLSYLGSISVKKSNVAAQKSMDVRLWPDRLRTVRFQFRINATAVAGHNREFPCTATAALVRSGPFKNPTRPRRHSTNKDDDKEDLGNDIREHQHKHQRQQQEPSSRIVVVAERKFLIKPGARCVCSDFACRCTCLLGMVSPTAATEASQSAPGAVATSGDGACQMVITFGGAAGPATTAGDHHHHHHHLQRRSGFWHWFCALLMLVLLVLLILGCIKAVLGCCCAKIGRWRYDFLQPTMRYKDAPSYRRFPINLIFFLVYPCVLCCRCFEHPDGATDDDGGIYGDEERDHLLQQQGLLKGAMVVRKQLQPSTTTITGSSRSSADEDILGDGWDSGGTRAWSSNNNETTDDELSRLLAEEMQHSEEDSGGGGRRPYYNNTEDEDNDTKFVLDVMNRSRKSLQTYRRFLINLIFFLVYPCVLCCRCFEHPDGATDDDGGVYGDEERDHLLQQQGLLKGAMVVRKQLPPSTTTITSSSRSSADEDILGDGWDSGGTRAWSSNNNETTDDELSRLLAEEMQHSEEDSGGGGRRPYYNNTEDEDNDTKFVLDVMNRSRKSLQTLSAASESELPRPAESSGRQWQKEDDQLAADQRVRELLQAKIVYRRMDRACGQVQMEPGQPYSIQGYFIAIDHGRYQFFTHALLRQFWMSRKPEEEKEEFVSKSSIPVRNLISKSFTKTYFSKVDVLRQNDLSVRPDKEAPCINVEYL